MPVCMYARLPKWNACLLGGLSDSCLYSISFLNPCNPLSCPSPSSTLATHFLAHFLPPTLAIHFLAHLLHQPLQPTFLPISFLNPWNPLPCPLLLQLLQPLQPLFLPTSASTSSTLATPCLAHLCYNFLNTLNPLSINYCCFPNFLAPFLGHLPPASTLQPLFLPRLTLPQTLQPLFLFPSAPASTLATPFLDPLCSFLKPCNPQSMYI